MARCHRIGQTKEVRIYRLVTKGTYEQQLFASASRKYGLDEAILGGEGAFGGSGGGDLSNPEEDKERIEALLKQAGPTSPRGFAPRTHGRGAQTRLALCRHNKRVNSRSSWADKRCGAGVHERSG